MYFEAVVAFSCRSQEGSGGLRDLHGLFRVKSSFFLDFSFSCAHDGFILAQNDKNDVPHHYKHEFDLKNGISMSRAPTKPV